MTLHQLKVFVTIVKLNGVAHAAKALHISQPSVSGVVQDLQNELGVKLFERLGNRRHLTEAGKRLLKRAESSLATIEGIREEIDELRGLKKGRLTVGGSGLAGTLFLAVAVQEFKKKYPNVEISLIIQSSENLERKLLDGELDLAIPARSCQSPLILNEPYREEEVVAIAPPKHPLSKKRIVSLELIAKQPLVAHSRGNAIRELVEQAFKKRGLPFRPALEVQVWGGARDAVKTAIARGVGIGFMTKCHIVSDVKAGRLKVLRVPGLDLRRRMYIAVHKSRQTSPLVKAFGDILKDYNERRGNQRPKILRNS